MAYEVVIKRKVFNIFETTWYQDVRAAVTPGEMITIYRENLGLTQAELARKIGDVTTQSIVDMESDAAPITPDIAEKLSQVFDIPIDRLLPRDA